MAGRRAGGWVKPPKIPYFRAENGRSEKELPSTQTL
jgi:hypothetical protein